MDRNEFKNWLINSQKMRKSTAECRTSNVMKLCAFYNLDQHFAKDECALLLEEFEYCKADAKRGNFPLHNIPICGDYYKGTATYLQALRLYVKFMREYHLNNVTQQQTAPRTAPLQGSVVFEGSLQDFKNYVGPFFRNLVQAFTRSERQKRNGVCEFCGKNSVLQSAHLFGEERTVIIETILNRHFKVGTDSYKVDIQEFEKLFMLEQLPVRDHFFFLCPQCHNRYDKKQTITTKMLVEARMKAARP